MPPKRKAPAKKAAQEVATEEVDTGAGGDNVSKKEVEPKQKKGKQAKEKIEEDGSVEAEVAVEEKEKKPEIKGKRGRAAKAPKEPDEEEEEPVEEETDEPPKPKQSKITKKDTTEEQPSEESNGVAKPKRGRGAKAASKEPEAAENGEEETKEKPQKRGKKSKSTEDKAKTAEEQAKSKEVEEEKVAEKPKRGRAAKKPAVVESDPEEDSEEEAPKAKRGRQTKKKSTDDKKEKQDKPLMNETNTNYDQITFDCERKNANDDEANFKIASWNVDGLRAWLKKDGLTYITKENPDILCLQETKCNIEQLPNEIKDIEGYEAYWQESEKDGYAGVALLSKTKPIDVKYGIGDKEHDDEGRCITAEFEKFYVVSVYVPNAGRKLVTLPKRLEWNKAFKSFIKDLDENKPVIICGDMNVAHEEVDLANPKTNKKNAGFTQEERDGMTDFLSEGFVDSFREFYPDKKNAYTFWTYMAKARAKNVGWRLDYFLVSSRFMDNICDNVIRSQIFGSDHCPIVLFLHI